MTHQLTPGTKVDHDLYGEGIIADVHMTTYDIYFANGGKTTVSKNSEELTVLDDQYAEVGGGSGTSFNLAEFEDIFYKALDKAGLMVPEAKVADKWIGGKVVIYPANPEQQQKEIPIDTFFHKITMVRERLRVLEQNINNHKKLDEEDKINLQQYISRAYGSLTTFNLLFAYKEDQFKGTGKSKEE